MPSVFITTTNNEKKKKLLVENGINNNLHCIPNCERCESCYKKQRPSYVGKEGVYQHAAIASDTQIGSKTAEDILRHPGAHVVDAAIASILVMGIVNYHNLGIGGGAFYNIYIKEEDKFYQLDARETAPSAAHTNMYNHAPESAERGALAIGVPGDIAAFWELHQKFGKLPWKDLFQPAIDLSRNGIFLSKFLHRAIVQEEKLMRNDQSMRDIFINPDTNELKKMGDIVKFEVLARTLEDIAEHGGDTFYKGSLADKIVDELRDAGSIITKEDLLNYRLEWREPIVVRLPSHNNQDEYMDIAAMPPPSSGALIASIMKTLNDYRFTPDDLHGSNLVQMQHKLMEVIKFAYGVRSKLGDEKFVHTKELIDHIISDEYSEDIRSKIDDRSVHPPEFYGGSLSRMTGGTAHLSLIGSNGDAISATSTINHYFGAQIVGKTTGICYNGSMDDFSLPVMKKTLKLPQNSQANYIQPGKRSMSTMSPMLVVDHNRDVIMSIGASGGARIVTVIAQIMARTLFMKESLKSAMDAPRIYEQWMPNPTIHDAAVDADLVVALKEMGHDLTPLDPKKTLGAIAQMVQRKNGQLHAYADTRKDGCACGI